MEPTATPLTRIRCGDVAALAEAFDEHRSCLRRIIALRMDRRLRGRVDVEDVLQESFLCAAQRCRHLIGDTARSLLVWLRLIVLQTLSDVHRRHLGTRKRDAGRECKRWAAADAGLAMPTAAGSAVDMAPAEALEQVDLAERLLAAMGRLEPIDRQVLVLRHVEELSNLQVSRALGIKPKAASIRYARALRRFKGLISEPQPNGMVQDI